jgi:hypothetical protein
MARNNTSSGRTSRRAVLCLVLLGAAALFAPLASAQPQEGRGHSAEAPGQERQATARAVGRTEDVRAIGECDRGLLLLCGHQCGRG